VYYGYDRTAAGFQFHEQAGAGAVARINYLLAIDGMSALLALLTSIIIFAGVFASWTVKERGQEFYALLLLLVTGVYGVFVSLDLFVFFLFYEIAVLPMYLLIGIWGSSGFVKPQGIFGRRWTHRRRHQGIRRDEADAVPAVRVGVHPRRHPGALRRGRPHLLVPRAAAGEVRRDGAEVGVPRLLRRLGILAGIWPLHTWSPDGHASAPTAVSMLHAGVLMKLGAYGVVRHRHGDAAGRHGLLGIPRRHHRLREHRLRRAERDGADRPEVRDRVLVVSHMAS